MTVLFAEAFIFQITPAMIKLVGIILLTGGISAIGTLMSSSAAKKCIIRKDTLNLLYALENGIRFGALPVDEIILRHFKVTPVKSNQFLKKISEENGYCYDSEKLLDKDERSTVNAFFNSFGKNKSCDCELANIRRFISEYETIKKSKDEKCKAQSMLYSRLGIICALAIAIILV